MLNLKNIHPEWEPIVHKALKAVDPLYLENLQAEQNWLPGPQKIFNAFSRALHDMRYILFGESPYPRAQSANGYAFWDDRVDDLWSTHGLSTLVNRATSLRNFIKMLLVAEEKLIPPDLSQPAIVQIDKKKYVTTIDELFNNLLAKGFLLLNATLVLSPKGVPYDAKAWRPFMAVLLSELAQQKCYPTLVLFGRIATYINQIASKNFPRIQAPHPYNTSFILNPDVLAFFKPLHLLWNDHD